MQSLQSGPSTCCAPFSHAQKYTDDGYDRPVTLIEAKTLERFGYRSLI
ncbi:MAG: hypothetical protein ABSE53_07435 [Terracidiphilus sp.]|jgi:hypothetical protein